MILLFCLNKAIYSKLADYLVVVRRYAAELYSLLLFTLSLQMFRTGHDSLRKRELRLARVSMMIVLIFMVCHSPKIVPTVCEIVHGDAEVT